MTPEERADAMPLHWIQTATGMMPDYIKCRNEVAAAIRAAMEEEREACAKAVEHAVAECPLTADYLGGAIRARGAK
jgi:hypothetical protein